ncbi:hypothetical protein PTKIN_Ptkin03bG0068200 [Pterospermum kingtungense]
MNRRRLRSAGDGMFNYASNAQYFTMVVHRGGQFIHDPSMRYTGKRVSYFDLCYVEMSMLDIWDMIEELGYPPTVATMPRNHYLHIWLVQTRVEDGGNVEDEPPIEVAFESENEDKGQNTVGNDTLEGEDENLVDVELESAEDRRENEAADKESISDFYESDYDMVDPDENMVEVNIDIGFEEENRNMNAEIRRENESVILFVFPLLRAGPSNENEKQDDFESENGKSDSLHSVHNSDSDSETMWAEFNFETDMGNPEFKKEMLFSTREVLKEAIKQYGRVNRYSVRLTRNDKLRVQAKCIGDCPWHIWAGKLKLKDQQDPTWQIKTYCSKHTCLKPMTNRNMTSDWIAKHYLQKFVIDPKYSLMSLKEDVMTDFVTKVSLTKCARARRLALEIVNGNYTEQYSKIYDYLEEVRQSNKRSTTICYLDARLFKRMYVCLKACKDGFKAGCRPIISLDGCFLKGYYGGQLLVAVGIDANDCIYPLAYAVVESECFESWGWFIQILKMDFELNNSYQFCFMSDKQKGLVDALLELMPNAEHRNCVRYLYTNFKTAGHKGKGLKDALWRAARSTELKEFKDAMKDLKEKDIEAYKWLEGKNPQHWSKSHFSIRPKCDMILNNLCESFNKYILEVRDKPILTLMETIKTKLMGRIAMKSEVAAKYPGPLCPKIQMKVDKSIDESRKCFAKHAGQSRYQVSCGPDNQHVVNLEDRTCSCKKWDLTGIPCKHAVSAMFITEERPESYVDECYTKATQLKIYPHFISPIRGAKQWRNVPNMEVILPPQIRRPLGHNVRTCKGEVRGNRTLDAAIGYVAPSMRYVPKSNVRRATTGRNTGIGYSSNQQARTGKKARTGNQPRT